MLHQLFLQWAEHTQEHLQANGIATIEFIHSQESETNATADPSTGVLHESRLCLGKIVVWASQQMEFEVIHIESEELILWKYIDRIEKSADFGELLTDYWQALRSGVRP
ncbi:hypothetical protein [Paenibacillus massiliensis]|uniref:immunity protein TriTu family protein n=1 Tax=Paenibacillus massiliensis TaxID=225917 RepID=UPI00036A0F65|nr:hypothetical protein [Paenibacillus massiliensis]